MEHFHQPEQLFAPSPDAATPNRTALAVQCAYNPDGKLQHKTERLNGSTDEYVYTFDRDGRLLETRLNGKLLEAYRYNSSGQRILHTCGHDGLREFERQFRYDSAGRLAQAGRAKFYYDRDGALGQRCDDSGTTFFEYSHDGSRLGKASRRDGWEILYRYGVFNGQPIRRLKNGSVTHEYHWLDGSRLSKCRDHTSKLEYQFFYDAAGKLERLRLSVMPELNLDIWAQFRPDYSIVDRILGPIGAPADSGPRQAPNAWGNSGSRQSVTKYKDPYGLLENCTFNDAWTGKSIEDCTWGDSRPNTFMDKLCEDMERNDRRYIRAWFDDNLTPLEFLCHTDQVGTLRAITTPNGAVVKEIKRDSFGIPYHDSFPNLHLPIGFAGGLEDPDTGLVRFGWRDYDPTIGRFTSLDPAKDRRGDGDLYDYCMDDPVSRVDPTGLWSKENFDESKVHRDPEGKFAPTGAGSGSGGGGGGGVPLTPDQLGEAHGNNYFPGSRMPGPEQWQSKPLSEELRQALADNRSHYSRAGKGPDGAQAPFGWKLDDINDNGEEKIRPLPKAPDPIPPGHPLTRFEELAIEKGHANRETLPQYSMVSNGIALNSGDHKGFETRDLRANSEILVYVTNKNAFPVFLEVQAGPSFHKNERQIVHLGIHEDSVLRFNSHGDLIRFLSITSNTASVPFVTREGHALGDASFLVGYKIYSRGHYARR